MDYKIKFLTNTHIKDKDETIKDLCAKDCNIRELFVGKPGTVPMITLSQPVLTKLGYVGIYERIRGDNCENYANQIL